MIKNIIVKIGSKICKKDKDCINREVLINKKFWDTLDMKQKECLINQEYKTSCIVGGVILISILFLLLFYAVSFII